MRVPLVLLAALALSWSPASRPAGSQTSGGPRAAFDQFISAFNALDWDTFRRSFADQASLFNPDIPEAVSLHRLDGRDDILRSFRTVFDTAHVGSSGMRGPNIHPERVRLQLFAGTAIITFEFRRSEHSTGRRTIVFNRQQGSWLIVHIHASNITAQ
jgi:ketosteroid isomerase-like protein